MQGFDLFDNLALFLSNQENTQICGYRNEVNISSEIIFEIWLKNTFDARRVLGK